MALAQVVGWTAVCPRDGSGGFSGSIQILTPNGNADLRCLSGEEFLRWVSILRLRLGGFVDLDQGGIVGSTAVPVAPS